jgi:hypothetical protein
MEGAGGFCAKYERCMQMSYVAQEAKGPRKAEKAMRRVHEVSVGHASFRRPTNERTVNATYFEITVNATDYAWQN